MGDLKGYLKEQLWSVVFCTLMTSALTLCACQGFNLDLHAISDSLLRTAALAAILQSLLALCGYSRRAIAAGVLGAMLVAGAYLFYLKERHIDIVDQLDSPTVIYIYPIILYLAALVVFLLARSRIGVAVLFMAGILIIGGLYYLEFDSRVSWLLLFLVGCMGQFVLLEYRVNALASVQYAPSFHRVGGLSVASSAAALLLAGVCFVALIQPLHPGTRDLTLLTQHIGLETLEATGIMDQYPVTDPSLASSLPDEAEKEEVADDPQGDLETPDEADETSQDADAGGSSSSPSAFGSGQEQEASAITYERRTHRILLACGLLLLLLAAAVAGKLQYRKYWYRKTLALPEREQIIRFYKCYLRSLERVGLSRIATDSARVYAEKNHVDLERFFKEEEGFSKLTEIFEQVRYGQKTPSKRDCQIFQNLYNSFYKNCKEVLGTLHYARVFFLL